jgi:hypothetical protein
MVGLYGALGGALFHILEKDNEILLCQKGKGATHQEILNLKSTLITYITESSDDIPQVDKNDQLDIYLNEFRDKVFSIKSDYLYSTNFECKETKRWTFIASLLFAITIFTTIGYGNIAPITWEGQVVVICYALFGIPLFLVCLGKISGILGDMFRFGYSRICCFFFYYRDKKKTLERKEREENDKYRRIMYELRKIEREKVEKEEKRLKELGLEIPASNQWKDIDLENNPEELKKKIDDLKKNNPKFADIEDDANLADDLSKVTVPLTITMLIITAYIVGGAFIFHKFEGWNLIASGYFCFITLSTIGFG